MLGIQRSIESPANLLLVEDDEVDAKWAIRALTETTFPVAVEHVDRLDLALKRLISDNIQVVLLDLGLPDADDEVSSIEKIHELDPDIPIIVYSGSAYEPIGLLAIEKGALYYFPKTSADGERLSRTVQQALERFQTQENLRRVIESSDDGMAIFSSSQKLLFANPAAEKMLRLNPDTATDYIFPYPLETSRSTVLNLSDHLTAELRTVSLEWNGRPAMLATLRDITERLRLERQLHQAQKMEAVGLLASGLAHDFNNILTVVTGYTDLVLENLPDDSSLTPDVNEIKAAGERAITLTRRLLTFSREDPRSPVVVDLDHVVRQAHTLLHRLIGEDIHLTLMTGSRGNTVFVDPAQIEQVIVNLAINSRDAMPQGGAITIETQPVVLDEYFSGSHLPSPEPGDYVVLVVSDTGIGMDEYTMNHMFDPFFTTKGTERGTGLGLSTTYGIVQQNGGYIWAYSEPGVGTTIKIYFSTVENVDIEPVETVEPDIVETGEETILLVEDESAVRKYACQVLNMLGYRVIETGSPQEALEYAMEHLASIDLLVTDIVMPGMNGRDLYDRLRVEAPGLPALFMSGYTEHTVIERGIIAEGMEFLQKPFTPNDLGSLVRRILDEE